MFRIAFCLTTMVLVVSAAGPSYGVVVPDDLLPGEPFHLAFVTADARDATSSNIMVYNDFVTAQAAQSPTKTGGGNWNVIGSTGDPRT